jgi:hypothetical protein
VDCNVIKCGFSIGSFFSGDVAITLNPCDSPASVALAVDLSEPVSIDWSDSWSLPFDDEVWVPVCAWGL